MNRVASNLFKTCLSMVAVLLLQSCEAYAGGETDMAKNINPDSISKTDREIDMGGVKGSGSSNEIIEAHLTLALVLFFVKHDHKNARANVDKAASLFKQDTNLPSYEQALIAASYDAIGERSRAAAAFAEVKSEWMAKNSSGDYLSNLIDLATSSPMVLDSYSVSIALSKEALRLANEDAKSSDALKAKILAYLGMLQEERGESSEAVEYLTKARTLLSEVNDDDRESKLFSVEFYLAKAYLDQKNYAEAESICKSRLEKEEALSFPDTKSGALVAVLAEAFYDTKREAAAKGLFESWKKKFENRSEHKVELLRAFADLDSKRKGPQQYVIRKLADDPTLFYELLAANKSLVNSLISHYYVLKECNLFHSANVCFGVETAFAKEADEHARARELSGPSFADRNQAEFEKLSSEEQAKLKRSSYEVKRFFDAYQKFLLQTNSRRKIDESTALFETLKKDCYVLP